MKGNKYNPTTSHRRLFAALAMLVFVLGFPSCDNKDVDHHKESLTVVSYGGGAYQQSHKTIFCDPFAQSRHVTVESVSWNADYGKLKAMVESGNSDWDVVEVTEAQFNRGEGERLFLPIGSEPADKSEFLPNTVKASGIGNVYWGTVLAFKKDAFTTNQPATWSDFWDTNKFPGARALYDDPRATLEFALLADGVPADKLYPLDVDRAYRKLDALRPNVKVWWSDGAQAVQLLMTNVVVMSPAWNGRIFANAEARQQIGYSWTGAALELDYWVVPRGVRNPRLAADFILFASEAQNLAKQCALIGYGPVNRKALDFIPEETRLQLPTASDNFARSFVVNSDWWSANEQAMKERWLAWKAKR